MPAVHGPSEVETPGKHRLLPSQSSRPRLISQTTHNLLQPTPPSPSSADAPTSRASLQASESEFEAKKTLFKLGAVIVPPQDEEKKARAGFSNQLEYILAVVGMSVGLGNIWRFPAVALENGGGAFLIPYLCMGLIFGLPMMYMDTSIGQFMQSSPSIVFKQYFPAAQGLGWAMALVVISVGFNYNVPCSWSLIYIVQLIGGRMKYLTSCDNAWNTIRCTSSIFCEGKKNSSDFNLFNHILANSSLYNSSTDLVYFNRSCIDRELRTLLLKIVNNNITTVACAPEEFFNRHITHKHPSFAFGDFNWMMAVSLFVCWTIVAAGLIKGVQSMGKVALVTTVLPYVIITILFFRGITLDGALEGIQFFLTVTDWKKMFELQTWKSALSQSCFSLSIGGGGLIMMSSYNKRNHPNYRDCVIILFADTFMSIFGGTAVFAIAGFMAQKMNVKIDKVVQSPLALTFIAYPEATSHMPASTLWALLFFFMMFFLGISTMFSFVEGLATCIVDENPKLVKWHWLVVTIICSICCLLNFLCFAFQNGFHLFSIFDSFLGLVSFPGCLLLELVIVMTYYGTPRLFRDIQCMRGLPTTHFGRIFGHLGLYIKITMTVIAPLFSIALCVFIIIGMGRSGDKSMTDTIDGVTYTYPWWTNFLGFSMGALPLTLVPIGVLVNYLKFRRSGQPTAELFRISDDHPAVRYNLPDPIPWREWRQWRHWLVPPLRAIGPESTNPSTNASSNASLQSTKKESEDVAKIPTIPASG